MNGKTKRTMALGRSDMLVSIGIIVFGGLLSGVACLICLPSHLSEIRPALVMLGFSQIIIFLFLFDLVCARFNEGESAQATSDAALDPETSPEELPEEAEERNDPPEERAQEMLRRIRRKPPKVDESE